MATKSASKKNGRLKRLLRGRDRMVRNLVNTRNLTGPVLHGNRIAFFSEPPKERLN